MKYIKKRIASISLIENKLNEIMLEKKNRHWQKSSRWIIAKKILFIHLQYIFLKVYCRSMKEAYFDRFGYEAGYWVTLGYFWNFSHFVRFEFYKYENFLFQP